MSPSMVGAVLLEEMVVSQPSTASDVEEEIPSREN